MRAAGGGARARGKQRDDGGGGDGGAHRDDAPYWTVELDATDRLEPVWHRVESAGLYWHLIDIVWIFLFPLLYLS